MCTVHQSGRLVSSEQGHLSGLLRHSTCTSPGFPVTVEGKHSVSGFHRPGPAPGRWSRASGLPVRSFPRYPAEALVRCTRRPHRACALPRPSYIPAEPALRKPCACVGASARGVEGQLARWRRR